MILVGWHNAYHVPRLWHNGRPLLVAMTSFILNNCVLSRRHRNINFSTNKYLLENTYSMYIIDISLVSKWFYYTGLIMTWHLSHLKDMFATKCYEKTNVNNIIIGTICLNLSVNSLVFLTPSKNLLCYPFSSCGIQMCERKRKLTWI
jgi:hypothetical protein